MDKIEESEELDNIFHDLKPLFLSTDCDFILVGGKNLDGYLYDKSKEKDAVVASIFSYKIYIPSSTFGDMRELVEKLLNNKSDVWRMKVLGNI